MIDVMLKRSTETLCPSSSERRLLENSCHARVDLQLKGLKNSSRRLNLALDAFRNDHKILERVYYKGKNQHRLSLFWRRVSEVRRFCQRLDEMHIDQTVEVLWKSFFSEGTLPFDRRATKGSWTYFPDRPFVSLVLQKLNMCSALVMRMQERLLEAYRFFTLAMQSGAFLQLILTLIAVVSRIKMACEALYDILPSVLDITRNILDLLSVTAYSILSDDHGPLSHGDSVDIEPIGGNSSTLGLVDTEIDASNSKIRVHTLIKREVLPSTTSVSKDRGHKTKKRPKKPKDEIDDIFGF